MCVMLIPLTTGNETDIWQMQKTPTDIISVGVLLYCY